MSTQSSLYLGNTSSERFVGVWRAITARAKFARAKAA